jgi:hypothetical protein
MGMGDEIKKYPVEQLFEAILGVIPGSVALFIYHLAVPNAFYWFFGNNFLGYKTKIAIALTISLLVGNSLTTFLRSLLGALGGAFAAPIAKRLTITFGGTEQIAPWRDGRWRKALQHHLGAKAPTNSVWMSPQSFDLRTKMIENSEPVAERPAKLFALHGERLQIQLDDSHWENWYRHFHQVLSAPELNLRTYFFFGLASNMETASVYALASLCAVPSLRHWWVVVPAGLWVLQLVAQEYTSVRRQFELWATLDDQIRHISNLAGPE